MKTDALEITGIRLIGFYFLFTTARYIAGAMLASFYEVHDPTFESEMATVAMAATISQSVLAILVCGLAFIAMFRPYSIQKRWRKIDSQNADDAEFKIQTLVLLRIAVLIIALHFGQKSLAGIIEILVFSNLSFFGSGSGTISYMIFFAISLYLFIKPEVISK